jgi:uncharacterized protein (TIGR02646 family)
MIAVTRGTMPQKLQDSEADWINELLVDLGKPDVKPSDAPKGSRYGHKEIKDALELMFGKKCAYCEGAYSATSYVHVEHFRPKAKYPCLAYRWTNLLPLCTVCNINKGDTFPLGPDGADAVFNINNDDTDDALLIDPTREDPTNFLYFEGALIVADKNTRGFLMIKTCQLNRSNLEDARRRLLRNVDKAIGKYELADWAPDPKAKQEATEELLEFVEPHAEFSACAKAHIIAKGLESLLPKQSESP